ncbi:MAG: DUF4421 domain-containing protein [Candidatus Amulumruptor caecigallinarius]|nr:DUF4421 domain-containing protein [Candidatus Amulumruptor caecigallinarius]
MLPSRHILVCIVTLLVSSSLFAGNDSDMSTDISASVDATAILPPDSINDTSEISMRSIINKLRNKYYVISRAEKDYLANYRYPRFIRFCIDLYKWYEREFNTYDPEYVASTGKHGKITINSDNWVTLYDFHTQSDKTLLVSSELFSNIGVSIGYGPITVGYSIDMNNIFSDNSAEHKKFDFTLNTSRFELSAYYWDMSGTSYIRKIGNFLHGDIIREKYNGLSFEAMGAMAFYIFNYSKYSHSAAYSQSKTQLKSAGSLLLGLQGTFYDARFDFTKIPPHLTDDDLYDFKDYRFCYNAVEVLCGYGFNWVINKHFLFNITAMPAIGLSFSHEDSSAGHRTLMSYSINSMLGILYTHKNLFVALNSDTRFNIFRTSRAGLFSTIENFSLELGVRF